MSWGSCHFYTLLYSLNAIISHIWIGQLKSFLFYFILFYYYYCLFVCFRTCICTSIWDCRSHLLWCCDVAVAQINYHSLKHNTQDSIEQVRGRSHKESSSPIFMLDDMQFRGGWTLSRLKQKKIKNYQAKLNKIRKLSREQTLVASTHPPTEIRTDHENETSIYIMNIYLFLTLVS